MSVESLELLRYRTCQTLCGRSERLASGKHNGKPAVFLAPVWAEGGPEPTLQDDWLEQSKLYVNLNEIERRTWRQILSALSVSAIARNEGVSRQAIYGRFLGKNDRGGMIEKNYWVLLWCVARGLYPRRSRRRDSAPTPSLEPVAAESTLAPVFPQPQIL